MATTTAVPRPLESEYTGPPKDWFLEGEWHRRDLEAVFRPRWLVAGHVDELATDRGHGYLTFRLGREEVLIRRDEEGIVRAFHNVCPHRGAQLCPDRRGSVDSKRIVCPYHAWTFSADDGRLLSARHMHEGFDLGADLGLRQVAAEVWQGLIFVCLADEPPAPPAEYLGGAALGGYDFEGMKLAAVKTHEIAANWKIVVENNLECYHCKVIHPELSAVFDWRSNASGDFDGELAARAAGLEVMEATFETPHTIGGEQVCALPAPRPDGDADPLSYFLVWEPGVVLNGSPDFGWMFVPRPLGPDRTELRQYWFVDRRAEEGRDYEVERLKRFWDTTMLQDRDICEAVQRGMEMPAYRPGPLNRVHQAAQSGFYAWYVEQIRALCPDLVTEPPRAGDGHGGGGRWQAL